ncbi:MAG: hypothetical protein ACREMA_17225, partial [Longimicrobiales bacterium]
MPRSTPGLRALATAALLTLGFTVPALAGPPWISIELPANPLDRTTRGAFLLVHTFHHDRTITLSVQGRAEGMVNGQRKSFPLTFESTSRDGVLALRRTWPEGGSWVLVITAGPSDGGATALVSIAADGEVRGVKVPTVQREGFTVPKSVTPDDVNGALR